MSGRRAFRIAMRLIGPLLLIWILWRVDDPSALVDAFADAEPLPVAVALLLTPVAIHLKLVRWRSLMRGLGLRLGLRDAYRAFLPSIYLGMVTPGRVGDVLRVQYLARDHGVPYADGLAISVIDRLCDVYVLLAFVSLGAVQLAGALSASLADAMWVGVLIMAIAPLALLSPRVVEPLARRLHRRWSGDASGEAVERFFRAARAQFRPRLVGAVVITAAVFVVNFAQAWLVARALSIDVGFFDVSALLAVSTLLSLLPISVSGLGVRESFFALMFPALGLAAAQGISLGLGVFVVIYLVTVLVSFVGFQLWPPPR